MAMIRFRVDRETGQRVPQPGCPVYTADGGWLGEVNEVRGAYIKIDAPLERDFWIRADDITGEFSDGLSVRFVEEQAGNHIVPLEDVVEEEDTVRATFEGEVILTPEEQAEQRERMERELAEQRSRLPHRHEGAIDEPPDTGGLGEPVEAELARREGVAVADIVREAAKAEPGAFGSTGAVVADALKAGTDERAADGGRRAKRIGMISGAAGLAGVLLFGLWWTRLRKR